MRSIDEIEFDLAHIEAEVKEHQYFCNVCLDQNFKISEKINCVQFFFNFHELKSVLVLELYNRYIIAKSKCTHF